MCKACSRSQRAQWRSRSHQRHSPCTSLSCFSLAPSTSPRRIISLARASRARTTATASQGIATKSPPNASCSRVARTSLGHALATWTVKRVCQVSYATLSDYADATAKKTAARMGCVDRRGEPGPIENGFRCLFDESCASGRCMLNECIDPSSLELYDFCQLDGDCASGTHTRARRFEHDADFARQTTAPATTLRGSADPLALTALETLAAHVGTTATAWDCTAIWRRRHASRAAVARRARPARVIQTASPVRISIS